MTKKKHNFHRTVIEHHGDKSHTVRHEHRTDPSKSKSYAAADLSAVHDGMQDHLNPPASPTVGAPAPGPVAMGSAGPAGMMGPAGA